MFCELFSFLVSETEVRIEPNTKSVVLLYPADTLLKYNSEKLNLATY